MIENNYKVRSRKGAMNGCSDFLREGKAMSIRKAGYTMARLCVMSIVLLVLLTAGHLRASLHAEYAPCSSTQGKVIEVKDNEVFTISVCEKVKVFREFSFCYDVEAGDSVFFDSDPARCEVTGFTVMRNGVQCGVICPEPDHPVKAYKQ